MISGPIPPVLGGLTRLTVLRLDRNRLKAEAAGRLAPATPEPQN